MGLCYSDANRPAEPSRKGSAPGNHSPSFVFNHQSRPVEAPEWLNPSWRNFGEKLKLSRLSSSHNNMRVSVQNTPCSKTQTRSTPGSENTRRRLWMVRKKSSKALSSLSSVDAALEERADQPPGSSSCEREIWAGLDDALMIKRADEECKREIEVVDLR
uniref:Uncharacterized protein n=1 Tax=Lotharella oceanica TaxID=641309 RepID=A0A7S2TKK6_9EUKA|mmetsp:Transcript_15868/g.30110  ORF Transcript_15868/g.30110 Transcript_15868/m.30110 type:complete len:159 (+) Transcript_15868:103-579(+)